MDNTQNPLSGLPNSLPQIPLPPASSPLPVSNGTAPAMVPPTPEFDGAKKKKKVPLKMVIGGVVAALVVAVVGVVASQLNTGKNIADTRSRANCLSCPGGTCPDGWSYGEDTCAPQASCTQRHNEACSSHQGGGGGGGGSTAAVCDGPQNHSYCGGIAPGGSATGGGVTGTCNGVTEVSPGHWNCSWTFAGACTPNVCEVSGTGSRKCNSSGSGWINFTGPGCTNAPACIQNGSAKGSGTCCSGRDVGGTCQAAEYTTCTGTGEVCQYGGCSTGYSSVAGKVCGGANLSCCKANPASSSSTGTGGTACTVLGAACTTASNLAGTCAAVGGGSSAMYCRAGQGTVACSTLGTSCIGVAATGATQCVDSSSNTKYCCPTGQQVSQDAGSWSCKIASSGDGVGGCCTSGAAVGSTEGCSSSSSTCTVDNGACATGLSCKDMTGCLAATNSTDCLNKYGGGVCKWTNNSCIEDTASTSCKRPSYQLSDAACPDTCSWDGSACNNKIPSGTAGCCTTASNCPSGQVCGTSNGTCASGKSCTSACKATGNASAICNGKSFGASCGTAGTCQWFSDTQGCSCSGASSSTSSTGNTCTTTAGNVCHYTQCSVGYVPATGSCNNQFQQCCKAAPGSSNLCKNPSSNANCNGVQIGQPIGPCTCRLNGGAGNDCSCYVDQTSSSTGGSCKATGTACTPGQNQCCTGNICSLSPGQGYVCNASDKNAYCGTGSVCGGSQGYIAFRCDNLAPSATSNGVPVCEGGNNQTFDTWAAAKAWVDQTGCGQVDEVCVNGSKNRQQCGDFVIVSDRCGGGGSSSSTPPGSSSSTGTVGACVETRIYVGNSVATMATTATPRAQLGTAITIGKTIRMAVRGNATTFNAGRFIVKRDGQVLGTFDVTQSRALPGDPAGKEFYYDFPITVAGSYAIQGFVNETPPSVTATPQPTIPASSSSLTGPWSGYPVNTSTWDTVFAYTQPGGADRGQIYNGNRYWGWMCQGGTCNAALTADTTVAFGSYAAANPDFVMPTSGYDAIMGFMRKDNILRVNFFKGTNYYQADCTFVDANTPTVTGCTKTTTNTISGWRVNITDPNNAWTANPLPDGNFDAAAQWVEPPGTKIRVNIYKGNRYWAYRCNRDSESGGGVGCIAVTTGTLDATASITDSNTVWASHPLPTSGWDDVTVKMISPLTLRASVFVKGTNGNPGRYWGYECTYNSDNTQQIASCKAVITRDMRETMSSISNSNVLGATTSRSESWLESFLTKLRGVIVK